MKSPSQNGFTLLEIILAISILATIGVLTINILSTQIDTRQRVTDQNSAQHSINMAMQRIYEDIQGAYISSTNTNDINSLNLSSRQVQPQFYFKASNLVFSIQNYKSYLANSNQSNLAFVRYYTRPDPKDSKKSQLIRIVDTDMAENIDNQGVGFLEIIVPDLKDFSVSFWNGNEYRREWDSTANDTQGKLPKLVKIHLESYFPETNAEKQLKELSPGTENKRRFIALDTIAYILSTTGIPDVIPASGGNYKWQ
jgi:general secretion pathway protein J